MADAPGGPSSEAHAEEEDGEGEKAETAASVREQGLKLLQVVRDAVNKEGHLLSPDFQRLPSKRQYPDYYQIIKKPISLDEIKASLDRYGYDTFDAVRRDFETCFRNAKRYNQRDSPIWINAKALHKVVLKEYAKMTGEEEGDDEAGSDADGERKKEKKSKPPSMGKILKSRLQKLIAKTDQTGHTLAEQFMDLPPRKIWPTYYKEIKKPQCFEGVFKRLKRKEYGNSADFAADVELIFSNAMTFNREHTPIWEDAVALRSHFRIIMSDLPPPHALPQYAAHAQLKLKVPTATAPLPTQGVAGPSHLAQQHSFVQQHPASSGSALPVMRATTSGAAPPAGSGSTAKQTPHANGVPRHHVQQPASAQVQPPPAMGLLPPQSAPYSYNHYPNAAYIPGAQPGYPHQNFPPTPSGLGSGTLGGVYGGIMPDHGRESVYSHSQSHSASPAPVLTGRALERLELVVRPSGRILRLSRADGVKTWAMRLAGGETGTVLRGVRLERTEDESSEEEDEEEEREREREAELEMEEKKEKEDQRTEGAEKDTENEATEEDGEAEPEPELEKPVKRKRGRPRKSDTQSQTPAKLVVKGNVKLPPKRNPLVDLVVKIDGAVVPSKNDAHMRWEVDVPVGSHLVEVGTKGGLIWKIFVERVAA